MIKKYIRINLPVEAVQWLGNNWEEVKKWTDHDRYKQYHPLYRWDEGSDSSVIFVRTLDGEMRANVGDWIVRNEYGEYIPYKSNEFSKYYRKTDDEVKLQLEDLI
jgi:hypothetical protein